jgi:hypothetical protein
MTAGTRIGYMGNKQQVARDVALAGAGYGEGVARFDAEVWFRFDSESGSTAGADLKRLREVAERAGFELRGAKVTPATPGAGPERLRKGDGGLLDRDDNLGVGARLLGRGCKDSVRGGLIAEPNTPSFSITEADVDHVFVGEQKLANLARGDPPQKSVLWRQDVLLGSPRGDAKYGRRASLDRGRFVASLATQEAEDDRNSDKGRASPHHCVRRRQAADCSARERSRKLAEGRRCIVAFVPCGAAPDSWHRGGILATARGCKLVEHEPPRARRSRGHGRARWQPHCRRSMARQYIRAGT